MRQPWALPCLSPPLVAPGCPQGCNSSCWCGKQTASQESGRKEGLLSERGHAASLDCMAIHSLGSQADCLLSLVGLQARPPRPFAIRMESATSCHGNIHLFSTSQKSRETQPRVPGAQNCVVMGKSMSVPGPISQTRPRRRGPPWPSAFFPFLPLPGRVSWVWPN